MVVLDGLNDKYTSQSNTSNCWFLSLSQIFRTMYNDTDKIIKRMKRKQKKKNDMKFRFIYPMIQINNKKKQNEKKTCSDGWVCRAAPIICVLCRWHIVPVTFASHWYNIDVWLLVTYEHVMLFGFCTVKQVFQLPCNNNNSQTMSQWFTFGFPGCVSTQWLPLLLLLL